MDQFEIGEQVCTTFEFFSIEEMKEVSFMAVGTVLRKDRGYLYVKNPSNMETGERWSASVAHPIFGPKLENGFWFSHQRDWES